MLELISSICFGLSIAGFMLLGGFGISCLVEALIRSTVQDELDAREERRRRRDAANADKMDSPA